MNESTSEKPRCAAQTLSVTGQVASVARSTPAICQSRRWIMGLKRKGASVSTTRDRPQCLFVTPPCIVKLESRAGALFANPPAPVVWHIERFKTTRPLGEVCRARSPWRGPSRSRLKIGRRFTSTASTLQGSPAAVVEEFALAPEPPEPQAAVEQRPPSPPVAELWPCTLPIPVTTVAAIPALPEPPRIPPLPPFAMVEARRELAVVSVTVSVEVALPPTLPNDPIAPSPPLPP